MHPARHAATHPDKPAYIMAATGETVTYRTLDRRADRGAHLLRSLGLARGDGVAIMMDNSARYLEILWAAERTGRNAALTSRTKISGCSKAARCPPASTSFQLTMLDISRSAQDRGV